METFKAKFIKIEIDGITYAGFLQEVNEAATGTTASFDEETLKKQQFLSERVKP